MKTSFRFSVLGALFSFALTGHAQVTYDNLSGTVGGSLPVDSTAVQTFTGFTNITSMTWQLKNASDFAQTATFNAYIGQWNSTTGQLVGTLTAFGSPFVSTGSVNSGATQNLTFNDAWATLDSSLTYALLLTHVSGSNSFGTNYTNNPGGEFFGSGGRTHNPTSFASSGSLASFEANLQNIAVGSPTIGEAYAMSVTGTLAAVPEPKTAAAAFAALFVVGLVGRRVWQRRKPAAPLLAA